MSLPVSQPLHASPLESSSDGAVSDSRPGPDPVRARRSRLAALFWTAAAVGAAAAPAGTWSSIETLPGRAPVTVLVESTPRTYFRATRERPLELSITGPARLRVVSRVEMPARVRTPLAYTLRVATERKLLEQQELQAPPSTEAGLPDSARGLGESRQMIVTVPRGEQKLTISVEGATAVLLRLLSAQMAPAREQWVTLTPIEAARSVTLKEDELVLPYYSVLPEAPVVYRVVGPAKFDLLSRLDFDPTMRGTESYRLAISDRGRPLREVQYSTTKALTASYPDLEDRVPGKFRRLRLTLSPGLHEIRIALLRPNPGSVEVRARIPRPAVGNIE